MEATVLDMTKLNAHQSSSPNRSKKTRDVFRRKISKRGTNDNGSYDESETSSLSATDSSSCIFRSALEDLDKFFDSKEEVQVDQGHIKCNFTELIEQTLLREGTSKQGKTSRLLAAKDAILAAINQDFTEILLGQNETSETSGLDSHLFAATRLVQEFLAVRPLLNEHTCMPESIEELIFTILQDFIHPRLQYQYLLQLSSSELTPGEAAKLVTWIEQDFLDALAASSCSTLKPSTEWMNDRDKLVQYYLEHDVRDEMKRSIQILIQQEVSLREDRDGHMYSGTCIRALPRTSFLSWIRNSLSPKIACRASIRNKSWRLAIKNSPTCSIAG